MKPDIAASSSHSWPYFKIRWQWIAIGLAALLILFLPLPLPVSNPVDRIIRVEASTFQFSPAEIAVNPGDRVTIELVATDVVHGFSLDGYNFSLSAEPGRSVSKTFMPDQSGSFRFRCSVPCGNLHPFMIGKLQVGQNTLFWRAIAMGILAVASGVWTMHGSRRKVQKSSTQNSLSA